ncbi:MAG: LPD38 domain-containing protein [Planctomycetota bacterium]
MAFNFDEWEKNLEDTELDTEGSSVQPEEEEDTSSSFDFDAWEQSLTSDKGAQRPETSGPDEPEIVQMAREYDDPNGLDPEDNQFTEGTKDVVRNTSGGIGVLLAEKDKPIADASAIMDSEDELQAILDAHDQGKSLKEIKQELIEEENARARAGTIYNEAGEALIKFSRSEGLAMNPDLQPKTFLDKVIRTTPQILGQVGVGILSGGTLSSAFMFSQILGGEYEQMINQGVSHERALEASLASAAIQTPLESIGGVGKLARFNPSKKYIANRLRAFLGSSASEGLTEAIQEIPSKVAEKWANNADPNKSELDILREAVKDTFTGPGREELFKDALEAGLIGMIMGGGMHTVMGQAAAKQDAIEDTAQANLSEEEKKILKENPQIRATDFDVVRQEAEALQAAEEQADIDAEKETGGIPVEAGEEVTETTSADPFSVLDEKIEPDETVEQPRANTAAGLQAGVTPEQQAKVKTQQKRMERERTRKARIRREAKNNELAALQINKEIDQKKLQRQRETETFDRAKIQQKERQDFIADIASRAGVLSKTSVVLNPVERFGTPEQKAMVSPLREAHKAIATKEESLPKLNNSLYILQEMEASGEIENANYKIQNIHYRLRELLSERIGEVQEQKRIERVQKETGATRPKTGQVSTNVMKDVTKQADTNKTAQAQAKARPALKTYMAERKKSGKELARLAGQAAKKAGSQAERYSRARPWKTEAKRDAAQAAAHTQKQLKAGKRASGNQAAKAWTDLKKGKETGRKVPKDLQAAIQLDDGQVILGNSHYEIMEKLTDAQLEQIDFRNVRRGFYTRDDGGFYANEESQKRYGVRKSTELQKAQAEEGPRFFRKSETILDTFKRPNISLKENTAEKQKNRETSEALVRSGAIKVGEGIRFVDIGELASMVKDQRIVDSKGYPELHVLQIFSKEHGGIAYGENDKRNFAVVFKKEHIQRSGGIEYAKDPKDVDVNDLRIIWPGSDKLIDFSILSKYVRQHPDLVQSVIDDIKFKRGSKPTAIRALQTMSNMVRTQQRMMEVSKQYNLGEYDVVLDYDGIPHKGIRERARAVGAAGVYDPNTGIKYIIASQHNNFIEMLQTGWHELGHYSLRDLAKKGQVSLNLKQELNLVDKQYKGEVDDFMARYGVKDRAEAQEEILVEKFIEGKDVPLRRRIEAFGNKIAIKFFGKDAKDFSDVAMATLVKKMRSNILTTGRPARPNSKTKEFGAMGYSLDEAARFRMDDPKWEKTLEGHPIKRMEKELAIYERIFGPTELAYDKAWGKDIKRVIHPMDLMGEVQSKMPLIKKMIDPKVDAESIADKIGHKGEARKTFLKEVASLRKFKNYISSNLKVGGSANLSLLTCQPTTQCSECYASTGMMVWPTTTDSAFRNTLHILADPKGWAEKYIAGVKKISQAQMPFIRLLGSGDLTTTEQITAFNHMAQISDRPIQIFSRHHENLAKLKGTATAPIYKMGSVDADLINYYDEKWLKENLLKRGIANAMLLTSEAEIPMIENLYDKNALHLVLAANKKLHDKLEAKRPDIANRISCPCDAHEREVVYSCRQCAMSKAGCMMAFGDKVFDDTGKVYDLTSDRGKATLKKGKTHSFNAFLAGEKPKTTKEEMGYAHVVADIIDVSIKAIKNDISAFKKGKKKAILLRDVRWMGEEDAQPVDKVETAEAYINDILLPIKDKALNTGQFYLPGGKIQKPVAYKDGKVVPGAENISKEDAQNLRFFRGDAAWEDPNIRFKRADIAPKKTIVAYKLFRTLKTKPGKLFPLFIGNQEEVKMNEWLEAEFIPTKGFSRRPGWHAGVKPIADHLSKKGRVWAEVEISADVDWQPEADKYGRYSKAGKWIPGDIKDRVPKGGHYRFPVNANQGAEWIIGGALRVNRLLTQEEVEDILAGKEIVDSTASERVESGINVRNEGENRFADQIVDGDKKFETRNTNSLKGQVGKRMAIIRTGEGQAQAIGEVTVGDPVVVNSKSEWDALRNKHLVPDTSEYAFTGQKYLYPMIDPIRYDVATPVTTQGIVTRRVLSADREQAVLGTDDTNPSDNTDDIRYSRTKNTAPQPSREPEYRQYIGPKANVKDNADNLLGMKWADKIATGLADSLKPLQVLENGKDIAPGMSGYKSMSMVSNMSNIFSIFMRHGKVLYKDHWIGFDPTSRGIEDIVKDLGDDVDGFFERALALSAEELRLGKRKNLFGTDKDGNQIDDKKFIRDILAANPDKREWVKYRAELRAINKSVLDFLEQAGMINPKSRTEWERFNYMPFFRVKEDEFTGDLTAMIPNAGESLQVIRRLKGSSKNVGDPLVNLIQGYSTMLNAGLINLARKKSIVLAVNTGIAERFEEKIKGRIRTKPKDTKGYVAIRHQGKAQYYKINDRNLYDALVDIDTLYNGWMARIFQLLGKPKRWLTAGVTVAPAFRVANFMRDTLNTAFLQDGFIPVVDSVRGLYHVMRNSDEFKQYAEAGGAFAGSYHSRDIYGKSEVDVKKIKRKLKHAPGPLTFWEKVGEASENAARVGAFLKAKKKGKTSFEAAYDAKDLLDFHKHGKWAVVRGAIQTIPFLNARIQGLYRLGRQGMTKKTALKLALHGTLYAAATLALLASYDEDDQKRFDKLNDHEKRMYHHFWIGGKQFRIPLPFEVGSIFGVVPTTLYEWYRGTRTNKELAEQLGNVVTDTLAFNPVPQFMKPWVEWWANKDSFTGQTTVQEHRKGLPGHLQADHNTSKLAVETAKLTGLSAKKMDKFMRDAFSWHWMVTKHLTDVALGHMGNYPEDPAGVNFDKWMSVLGPRRFYRASKLEQSYTRETDQFYKMKQEVDEVWNEWREYMKTGQQVKAREFRAAHREEIRVSKQFRQAQRLLSTYKSHITKIRMSRKLSPEEKTEQINKWVRKRNELISRKLKQIRERNK